MIKINRFKSGVILLSLAALTVFSSCMSLSKNEVITAEELEDTLWLSPVCGMPEEGRYGEEGFFLAEDGSLLFVNIFSMTGDTWSLEGNMLQLYSHTLRYPDPRAVEYPIRKADGVVGITPLKEELEMLPATARKITAEIPEGRWLISVMPNPDSAVPNPEQPAYLLISRDDEGRTAVSGNGGVNNFRDTVEFDGFEWKGGPLMRTLMAGPGLEYEDLLMKNLDAVNRYLVVDDFLFLYEGSEPVLILRRT